MRLRKNNHNLKIALKYVNKIGSTKTRRERERERERERKQKGTTTNEA